MFRSVLRELSRDPVMRWTAALFAVLAVPYLVVPLTRIYAMLRDIPFLVIATAAFWAGRRRTRDPDERRFWALCATAYVSWLVVRVGSLLAGAGQVPEPSINLTRDLVWLVFYVCLVLALELRPARQTDRGPERRLRAIRSLAAVVFAFGLVVYFAMLPVALNATEYATRVPSFLLYAVLDGYLVVRLAGLFRRALDPRWRETYRWLLLTTAVWALSDLSFALEALGLTGRLPQASFAYAVLQLDYLAVVAAARIAALPRFARAAPPPTTWQVASADARGLWGGPLVMYLVALPVLHFGLYRLQALDPGTRASRELLLLALLVVLAMLTFVYQRALQAESQRLGREAQERRQQAQRLEALGQLAAGIAHDFNNLMTVMMGSAGFIKRALGPDQERLRADLHEIEQAVRRGAEMVRRLLAFGRREGAAQTVDLHALVDELGRTLRRLLPEHIALQVDSAGATRPVTADAAAVEHILLNLVTNSRDAMPAGGRLRIVVSETRLDEARCTAQGWGRPGEFGLLAVSDTGTGMDAEVRRRLFEPFFTTKADQGSGLGMAMVADLVRLNRGFVNVETAPGQGTTVEVYLPLAAPRAPEPVRVEPERPPAGGVETILVVEDEATIRTLAQRTLESCGYRVLTAGDGRDGLRVFQTHANEIDLVFSDVVMPRMSGPELYAELRRKSPVRFIFTTGYTEREARARGAIDAATPCLYKPWAVDDLIAKVREVLDRTPAPES